MPNNDLPYLFALKDVKGVGPVRARKLLEHFGTAKAIFSASKNEIEQIEGFGTVHSNSVKGCKAFDRYQSEIDFIEKNKIQVYSILDDAYPIKLKRSVDAPLLLFYKGDESLNKQRVVSIIGTRTNSEYGQAICEKVIQELSPAKPLIVSGLAYGIDIIAHRAALKNGLPTIGVLAHGLDVIYPSMHRKTAEQMLEQGGLLTEFYAGTKPNRENFPSRNRLVAGISDAVIVIESAKKGGSMITAEIAYSYHKDIFCVPGRLGDNRSEGCNQLIKSLKANILTSGKDVLKQLNWDVQKQKKYTQREIFSNFSTDEKKVYELLNAQRQMHIEEMMMHLKLSSAKLSAMLLGLEMQGVIRSLPGKRYELV